jgi:hypothetical protein
VVDILLEAVVDILELQIQDQQLLEDLVVAVQEERESLLQVVMVLTLLEEAAAEVVARGHLKVPVVPVVPVSL